MRSNNVAHQSRYAGFSYREQRNRFRQRGDQVSPRKGRIVFSSALSFEKEEDEFTSWRPPRRRNLGGGRRRSRPIGTTTTTPYPSSSSEDEDEDQFYGNYLEHVGYRRASRTDCPQGQVRDIYGYCRYNNMSIIVSSRGHFCDTCSREAFHEESRDWDWWRNVREHIMREQRT